ncbi:hypothetical protein ABD77_14455 [Brevibacillus formosus]|nr:hypothetical protein [Brevibacillus formosus]
MLESDEKMNLIRILRAQLSTYELLMLFYNLHGTRGTLKFKKLAEEYRLLHKIQKDLLINLRLHTKFYDFKEGLKETKFNKA